MVRRSLRPVRSARPSRGLRALQARLADMRAQEESVRGRTVRARWTLAALEAKGEVRAAEGCEDFALLDSGVQH